MGRDLQIISEYGLPVFVAPHKRYGYSDEDTGEATPPVPSRSDTERSYAIDPHGSGPGAAC